MLLYYTLITEIGSTDTEASSSDNYVLIGASVGAGVLVVIITIIIVGFIVIKRKRYISLTLT